MSLVTRCTTCGTVFRVVQDQLKVSGGWVRCGRCGEVFNALQTLFDLERDGPVAAPAAAPTGPLPSGPPPDLRPSAFAGLTDEPPAAALGDDRRVLRGALPPAAPRPVSPIPGTAYGLAPPDPEALEALRAERAAFRDDEADGIDSGYPPPAPTAWGSPAARPHGPAFNRSGAGVDPAPEAEGHEPGHDHDHDRDRDRGQDPAADTARWNPDPPRGGGSRDRDEPLNDLLDDADSSRPAGADGGSIWPSDSRPARWIEPPLDAATGGGAASDSRQMVVVDAAATDEAPAFLREDARRQRAASPVLRGLLSFTALGLAATLVGQWALHDRDRVADLWPWSRPLLVQACRVAGCELLEAPRRLDAFTVESTTLTRAAAANAAYRLSITLRNRTPRAATLPSVELALTDTDGQLVARRALHPADFRIQRPIVPGGADTTLQLLMTAPRDRVNGYTIEIFYP